MRDDHHLLDELVPHGADGLADELGAIVGGHHLHALGQGRAELGELGLHALDDVERVLALAHHHDPAHHVPLAVQVGHAAPDLRAERHLGDVLHLDGRASLRLQHQLLQIRDRLHVAAPAHHVLAAGELDEPPAHVVVPLADGGDDRLERELVGGQLGGVDGDLVLADLPPHGGHLGHARDRLDRVAQEPVLVGAQLVGAVQAAPVHQRVLEDPAHAAGVRTELGLHPGRELAGDLGEVLEDPGAGPVGIGAVLEDDVDVAESKVGEAADRLHLGCSEERRGDGIGDLVLDDVGAAIPARVDDDLGVGEVGQGVERDVPHRVDAEGEQHQRPGDDQEPVLGGESDDPLDHPYFPPMFAREARRRDSESTRKLARVTTSSPSARPEITST